MEKHKKETPGLEIFVYYLNKEFPSFELERALRAFSLMKELHGDQDPRPDGIPYTEHPLAVATHVLKNMKIKVEKSAGERG